MASFSGLGQRRQRRPAAHAAAARSLHHLAGHRGLVFAVAAQILGGVADRHRPVARVVDRRRRSSGLPSSACSASAARNGGGATLVSAMRTRLDLAAIHAQHHRGGGGGPVAGLALELLVGVAGPGREGRHPDLAEDFVLGHLGHVDAVVEAVGLDAAPALRALRARTWRRARWRSPGGRCRDRRGRCRRRSCRGCAPADRRSGAPPRAAAAPSAAAGASRSGRSRPSWHRCTIRPPSSRMPRSSAMRFRSIRCAGCAKRSFIIGSRLWPPASSLASPPRSAEQPSASATGRGA